jgi:hypothetical protein
MYESSVANPSIINVIGLVLVPNALFFGLLSCLSSCPIWKLVGGDKASTRFHSQAAHVRVMPESTAIEFFVVPVCIRGPTRKQSLMLIVVRLVYSISGSLSTSQEHADWD